MVTQYDVELIKNIEKYIEKEIDKLEINEEEVLKLLNKVKNI